MLLDPTLQVQGCEHGRPPRLHLKSARGPCQAAFLALILLVGCGTVRSDLIRSGTLALRGGRAEAIDAAATTARLSSALEDRRLLDPAVMGPWQTWLGGRLSTDPERVALGLHPHGFPLQVPDDVALAIAWELEPPYVAVDREDPARAEVLLGWRFVGVLQGDLAKVQPDRVERLATALLAGHLVGVLRDLGWTLDPETDALLAPP